MGRSRLRSFQRIQPLSEAITMATVRYNPQEPGPDYWSLTEIVLYWSLRGFTFLIALGLGFTFIAAYVAIPFYASEGYSAQFEDRILVLLSDFLLFITIIIPHRWIRKN